MLYFAHQAQLADTDFDVRADVGEDAGVAEDDLSVLLGNLLENALHACGEVVSGKRLIRVRIKQEGQELFIAVDNSFSGKLRRGPGGKLLSTKKDGLFCVSALLRRKD